MLNRVPTLLAELKEPLHVPLASLLTPSEGLYRQTDYKGDELFAMLWLLLVAALGGIVRKPCNVKPEAWQLPAVEPEMLRKISAGLKAGKATEHVLSSLKQAAGELEAARRAQQKAALEVVLEPQPKVAPAFFPATTLEARDVLGDEEVRRLFAEEPTTEAAQAKVQTEIERAERALVAFIGDERVAILVEPPPHPRDTHKIISRLPCWKVCAKSLAKTARKN